MRRSLVLLAVLVGLLSAPPAGASEVAEVEARLAPDGSGSLLVYALHNSPDRTWSWEACTPDLSSCAPFGTGREISTAGAAAGTVFRATSNDDLIALSPLWHGNLVSLAPPSVSGAIRANEFIAAIPGQWSGGWDGDYDLLQLSACVSPDGALCTTLTDIHYPACGKGAVVVDPAFAGRYLRVAASRIIASTVFLAFVIGSPYGSSIWGAGPLTSVGMVGQIAPAAGPRTVGCGPPPLVEASISKKGVARVRCGFGCRTVLIAKRGSRQARLVRTLPSHTTPSLTQVTLRLPRRSLARIRPGRTRMIVRIDGKRATQRTVRLGFKPRVARTRPRLSD